jgi:hypothetical protein
MESKKNFLVTIEETISQEFSVKAESYDEAVRIASNKYKSGEFVLSPGNVVHKKMTVENIVEGKDCEWFEF